MARTVKAEEFAAKRKEILVVAQRLVFTKGYEQMAIRDILDALQISSGAFHHYFDSRGALLDALIEQIKDNAEAFLLPIIQASHLTAIEKLQGFFDTLDRVRIEQKTSIIELGRVWYSDDNAIIRHKVDEAVLKQRSPLLTHIVQQGIREGIFTTPYPDQSGEIMMTLIQGMGNTHAKLLFSFVQERDEQRCIESIVATHAAYMDAIERVLGAPTKSLYRTDAEAVKVWVTALREEC